MMKITHCHCGGGIITQHPWFSLAIQSKELVRLNISVLFKATESSAEVWSKQPNDEDDKRRSRSRRREKKNRKAWWATGSGELTTAPPRPHSASGSVWEPQRSVCTERAAWMEVMGSAAGDALGLNASWLFQLHPPFDDGDAVVVVFVVARWRRGKAVQCTPVGW